MAGSVNKVILVGRLGRDPEVRTMQNGGIVANLSVATSETWRDKNSGERQERTEWHRVVIFNEKLAEVAEQYLKKGALVYIEGALQTRKWTDKDGVERYSTEVVLARFRGELNMLGGKGGARDGDGDEGDGNDYSATPGDGKGGTPGTRAHGSRPRPSGPIDDDIPFAPQVD